MQTKRYDSNGSLSFFMSEIVYATVIADGIGFLLMTMVYFNTTQNRKNMLFADQFYFGLVRLIAFLCIVDLTTYLVDGATFTGAREVGIATNSLLIILTAWFAYRWTIYADYRTHKSMRRIQMMHGLMEIPFWFASLLVGFNLFNPVIFEINENNVYERGVIFYVIWVIDFFYLFFSVVTNYVDMKKSSNYQFFSLSIVFFTTGIAFIVQFFMYGVSLIYVSFAIAFVEIYFDLQNETSYIDPLSKVFNRQYLGNYLSDACYISSGANKVIGLKNKHSKENMIFACLLLDVDHFKQINDNYGHLTGDKAIADIGRILLECAPKDGICGRYGGDEFVMALFVKDVSELDKMKERIQKKCQELNDSGENSFKLEVSIGSAVFRKEDDTVESLFCRLDEAMYEVKKNNRKKYEEKV